MCYLLKFAKTMFAVVSLAGVLYGLLAEVTLRTNLRAAEPGAIQPRGEQR